MTPIKSIRIIHLRPVDSLPALLLENDSEKILVVADLHIGWEATLTQCGIHNPSQTTLFVEKMKEAIRSCRPSSIFLLGDIKHDVKKLAPEEWRHVPQFFEKISSMVSDIHVIPGNHDGNLDALSTPNVKILNSSGVL